jgi:hypothetical protein
MNQNVMHRVFRKINETTPAQLPVLLRAMAESCDLESLGIVLESGALEACSDTFGIACAIAPLTRWKGDQAVSQFCKAWLSRAGFNNADELSMALADAGAKHVADLVMLGADPRRWVRDEETRNEVTPLQRSFSFAGNDNARIELISALLDVMRKEDSAPMSLRRVASDGSVLREVNLFDRLLSVSGYTLSQDSFFWDQMLRYLARSDIPQTWRRAAGDALLRKCAAFARDGEAEHHSHVLEYFMDLLPLARFGSAAGWALVIEAVDREEFVPLLGSGVVAGRRDLRALENMVADGVNVDDVPGKVRLVYEGVEHFVPARGNWLHWSIDNGRFELFSRLLEAGANPKTTLGEVDPTAAPDIRSITPRHLIEMNAMSNEGEWLQALDVAVAKRRIDETLFNAKLRAPR